MTGLARSYLFAHFGKSLMWHGGNIAFAFFLTEICGQSPGAMGWLLATSSIINAVADGVIGTALAGRITDGASASRQQLAGAIGAGIAFAAFCATGLVSGPVRFGYAMCSLFAFRIAYATMDVPQNALVAYLPVNTGQQEQLITARMMTGYAAQVATAALISSLLWESSSSDALYFALAGSTIGMLAIVTAFAFRRCWRNGKGVRKASLAPVTAEPVSSFVRLLIASGVFAFASTFVLRAQTYIAAYGPGVDQGVSTSVFVPVAMAIGGLVGQPLWAMLCRRRGVLSTLRIASAALIGGALLFGASASAGSVCIALATALFGAALGGTSFALWALLARGARDGRAAMRFGIFTCTSKFAQALSAVALGAALTGVDYRAAVAAGANLWSISVIAAMGLGAALLLFEVRLPVPRRGSSV
ncbi:MFS transporter [Sphingomonas endolithica]|uniref:MFS transporter n=1 Tax=Sphingomonas endolithica TaxID=2972485 RepID=UPI0021AFB6A0|nr:MFS transporter [Sphingomonas sp. ZFBP2030]